MSSGVHAPDPAQRDIEDPDQLGTVPANGLVAADRLRSLIERIERLDDEKKGLASDIKDIYAECKSAGFDPKVVRKVVALRKLKPADVEEQETLLDVYRRALGM